LWFSVHEYLSYQPADQSGVDAHRLALQAALGNKSPHSGIYGALGSPYSIKGVADNNASAAFQSAVQVLSGQGFRADATVFARFHGLKLLKADEPFETQAPHAIRSSLLPDSSGYELADDAIYAIDVSTYHKDLPNRQYLRNACIEVAFDPGQFIELGRRSNLIRGRYDRFAFALAARRRSTSSWTSLVVRGSPGIDIKDVQDDGRQVLADFRSSEWTIPVRIKVPRNRRLWRALPRALAEAAAVVGASSAAALVAAGEATGWIILAIVVAALGASFKLALEVLAPEDV